MTGRKHQLGRWFVLVFAVLFCAVGVWGLARQFYFTRTANNLNPKKVITHSVGTPNEAIIPPETDYEVAADKPRQIDMPSIGLKAFIQQVDIDQYGRVAVPDNVNLVGWYIKNEAPGEPGLSIVDGHVYGQYGEGIFFNLHKAAVGDLLSVEYGDKEIKFTFRVKAVLSVPDGEATEALFKRDPSIVSQLNLITCAAYNPETKKYDRRLIVIAERV